MMTATLGQLLGGLRLERGLALRELGRQAGISYTTIGRWERGTFLPRLPELEAVLTALNATESQRRQAIERLAAPRALAQRRQETALSVPDFVEAAGGVPGNGDILRAMRLRAGKTLEDTARVMGVAERTLLRWERSESRPDTARLHALCYALGASEEEVAALTCSEGGTALIPLTEDVAQIATLGLALRMKVWQPPVALRELICLGLEAQAWRLVPTRPEAQSVVFALSYWRLKTLFDSERYVQAVPYMRRVLKMADTLPPSFTVPLLTEKAMPEQRVDASETHNRLLIYQTLVADWHTPTKARSLARRLAREWHTARDVYFRAWMMGEAAGLLAKSGDMETAKDWSRRACEEADTGNLTHWTEVLYRRRSYAAILAQAGSGEEALAALESTTALNDFQPDCRTRYHLLRTEIFLNLDRPASAQEELVQARRVAQGAELAYLLPHADALERRF